MLAIGLWMMVGGYIIAYWGYYTMTGKPISLAELITGKK